MANAFRTPLAPFVRLDGAWLRCVQPDCDAYWGAFRPTAWVAAKAGDHAARKHGARRPAAGLRPQRRAANAEGAPAGLLAAVDAFVAAHVGGAARLGKGVSREVFPFGPDHVLKVAFDPHEGHNAAEYKAYQQAPAWARPLLAPALAVDPAGKWLLMRKASRIGEASWRDCEAVEKGLRRKVADLHPANVGWLDGRWVAVDYAGGWKARDPWA